MSIARMSLTYKWVVGYHSDSKPHDSADGASETTNIERFFIVVEQLGFMEKFYVEETSDLRYDLSPGGPLINDSTCLVMRSDVRDFLVKMVSDRSIDSIVSIPRKGTWMIDDAINTFLSSGNLRHLSFGTDYELPEGSNVMIFDDSINTGNGVSKALDWVLEQSPKTVIVASLAITGDTLRLLKEKYEGSDVCFEPMRVFESYKDFNAYSELRSGCQNYYFATAIIPYVNTLNSNRNPGFCNWVIGLDRSYGTESVLDAVRTYFEGIGGIFNPYEKGVAFDNAIHMTFDLDVQNGGETYVHGGFSKIRVSLVDTDISLELSVAPIICPDIRLDEIKGSSDDEVMSLSFEFLEKNKAGLMIALAQFNPKDLGMRNLDPVH